VCQIITACSVLHNIRRDLNLPDDENFEADEEQIDDYIANRNAGTGAIGEQIRQGIANRFVQ
jgi:hypothetical protein